jgi:ubiquinone/menaquinone biosynthesis C-methylase UbiE
MTRREVGSKASHLQIWHDLTAFAWRGLALAAAVELDLFGQIAAGNTTAEKIAARLGASEQATRRLLTAIAAMGYLKRAKGSYRLEPLAAEFLVPGGPLYMGQLAQAGKGLMTAWSALAEVVKSGQPFDNRDSAARQQFFAMLVPGIFTSGFLAASAAVKKLSAADRRRILKMLDVGAGAAAWSIPFAKAIKGARVTVVDYPAVTPVARQFAQRFGVADRYDYLEGDFREVEFGTGQFDLVILEHIILGEGADWGKRLLRRTYEALADRGLLLIGEFLPNDDRSGPLEPLLFGLNMLINTEAGDTFTMGEYRQWLKEAGFSKVRSMAVPHYSPLIVAAK